MSQPVETRLFIAPGCPHCGSMIKITTEMVKSGEIGHLEIINIASMPEMRQQENIRSVPTLLLGSFRLTGGHSQKELQDWIAKAGSDEGLRDYLNQSFDQGELEQLTEQARQDNSLLKSMLDMLAEPETPITSKIGISAVFESFTGEAPLLQLIDEICAHAGSSHASIRADMAYLLGLTENNAALPCLQSLATDEFADVQETALEAIEQIQSA